MQKSANQALNLYFYLAKFAPLNLLNIIMKLSQFKFDLPDSLIAHNPAETRDEARLMVLDRKTGAIEHKIFKDILMKLKMNEPLFSKTISIKINYFF